jgi:hypothetical protein
MTRAPSATMQSASIASNRDAHREALFGRRLCEDLAQPVAEPVPNRPDDRLGRPDGLARDHEGPIQTVSPQLVGQFARAALAEANDYRVVLESSWAASRQNASVHRDRPSW